MNISFMCIHFLHLNLSVIQTISFNRDLDDLDSFDNSGKKIIKKEIESFKMYKCSFTQRRKKHECQGANLLPQ